MNDKADETSSFVTTTSDVPVLEPEAKDEVTPDSGEDKGKSSSQESEAKQSESDGDNSDQDKVDGDNTTAEDDDKKADADKGQSKKSNRVQKRIDQVVREREEQKRENERLQRELDELKKDKEKDKSDANSDKEPVESDFDTYDEYLDAVDKYDQRQNESKEESKPEAKDKTSDDGNDSEGSQLTDAQRTAMAIIKEKVSDGSDKYEDFEEVALDPSVPITGEMLEALAECDDPTKVIYHLGKNKDLAANIAESSPAQQMREIAKLDLTVEVKPPKPTKTTQAADPIKPVGGADAQQKPISDMSFAEYEAHMNKKERDRGSDWS